MYFVRFHSNEQATPPKSTLCSPVLLFLFYIQFLQCFLCSPYKVSCFTLQISLCALNVSQEYSQAVLIFQEVLLCLSFPLQHSWEIGKGPQSKISRQPERFAPRDSSRNELQESFQHPGWSPNPCLHVFRGYISGNIKLNKQIPKEWDEPYKKRLSDYPRAEVEGTL